MHIDVVQVYPDVLTKVLSLEPLTFFMTIEVSGLEESPEDFISRFRPEIWTNIPCKEFERISPKEPGTRPEYAAVLRFYKREGDFLFFKRTITPSRAGFYEFSIRYRLKSEAVWNWWGGENRSFAKRKVNPIYVEPSWLSDTIIYNAFVRQFGARDDNKDGIIRPGEGGTFNDLIKAMPRLANLGIGAIYLNPIQKVGDLYHYQDETNSLPSYLLPGSVYSLKEYKSIDPELGLNEEMPDTDQYHEFKRFVKTCHMRGIRVILDMVFDHTAKDSFIQRIHPEWFLYKRFPHSLEGPYLYPDGPNSDLYWGKPEHAFSPFDHDIFWKDCAQINWNFRYAPAENEPPRNPRIREMREYFKNVLKYWIKNYGVDGFRLDVAYAVPPNFWHEAIEETRRYAEKVCSNNKRNPADQDVAPLSADILFIGETYVNDVFELQECGIDCLNGDFAWKIHNVESLKGYLDYAYNISGEFFPRGSWWMQFPECHDHMRLPEKFKDLLHSDKSDVRLNKSRWVLTALLPGIPMLHNGYEVVEHKNVSVLSYTPINWDSPNNISEFLGSINSIRNDNVAFQKGSYHFVMSEQGVTHQAQIFAFLRNYNGSDRRQTCLVVVNLDVNARADHVKIDLPELEGYDFSKPYVLKDLLKDSFYERTTPFLTVVLEPGECHIFEIMQE